MSEQPRNLTGIVTRLRSEAEDGPVSIGSIVTAAGTRSVGPLLFIPAVIAISPIGGIPGLPTILAVVIVLMAMQSLVSRDGVWLPSFIGDRSLPSDKVRAGLKRIEGVARGVDRFVGDRLGVLVRPPLSRLAIATCLLLACAMIPLELVPFAVMVPAGAILLLSVGLVTGDGLLIALGYGVAAVVAYLVSLLV